MPRTGSNIYKRRDGRWEGRYPKGRKSNGRIAYGSVYGKSFKEAKAKLQPFLVKPKQTCELERNTTFEEIALAWLSTRTFHIKKSTYARYTDALTNHILPYLGRCKLSNLSTDTIDQFTKTMLSSGRLNSKGGLSPKTVRDFLVMIKSILRFMNLRGFNIEMIRVSYPRLDNKEAHAFTKNEQKKLEQELMRNMDGQKLAVMLSLYTGLRIGEICALQWKDISLQEQLVLVRKTVQRIKCSDESDRKTKVVIGTPKSEASFRQVPLPSFLAKSMKRLAACGDAYMVTGQVNKPAEVRTVQYQFNRFTEKARVSPLNFHALRHTYATRCIQAGVDVKSLSETLGHASVKITLDRYVHTSLAQKRKNTNKLVHFMSE